MDNKTKLRILSKVGILLVFIGFFLPISCNQNGFQIAKTLETFGGPNLLSICLYIIFLGSCAGIILFIFLLQKIMYNIKYDWINLICIILPFSFLIYTQIKEQNDSIFGAFFQLQSGAYIISLGLLISIISLIFITSDITNTNIIKPNIEVCNSIAVLKIIQPILDKQYKENKKDFNKCIICMCGSLILAFILFILLFLLELNQDSTIHYIVLFVVYMLCIASVFCLIFAFIFFYYYKEAEKRKKELGIGETMNDEEKNINNEK